MARPTWGLIPLALVALLACAGPAAAQQSLCADCHFANSGKPNPGHLFEWDMSPHARANVGCDACHGGNPKTVESFLAHQAIVRGHGPDSPVNRNNLPRTCGRCHVGPVSEFQTSKHFALLTSGDPYAPTCSTCHGEVAAHLLSPKSLESQCNDCHDRGKKFERLDYGGKARALLQQVRDTRTILDSARSTIKRVKDARLRDSVQYDHDQALVPLQEAVHAAHRFVFDAANERVGVAHRRADALADRLANLQPSRPR
jgi:hypothetical protein